MTRKQLFKYMIPGFLFISITGTLFHFIYEWSGNNKFIGSIAPVNESTWEHMKLIFFPMVVYAVFLRFRLKNTNPYFAFAAVPAALAGTVTIPVFFYTYSGILGFYISAVNILIFYISVIFAFLIQYILSKKSFFNDFKAVFYLITALMIYMFILFSYNPPDLGIFADPLSK